MYRIGLTGGIASGKSTVAQILQQMGLPVINLDLLSREILQVGTPAYREVLAAFGQAIVLPSGEIDRKALGTIVFGDTERRKRLEGITHPHIRQLMEERIAGLEQTGERVVVVEVPLLIEKRMMDQFDQVWLVYVDEPTQLTRLKARDLLDESGALARLHAQMPLAEKRAYADYVIENTGNVEALREKLTAIWREVKCKESL